MVLGSLPIAAISMRRPSHRRKVLAICCSLSGHSSLTGRYPSTLEARSELRCRCNAGVASLSLGTCGYFNYSRQPKSTAPQGYVNLYVLFETWNYLIRSEQGPQPRTHLSEVPSITISLERQRFGMSTSEEPMGSLTSCLGQQVNKG
jgi:hypothetical protein